jgi:hypothetical protein
MEPIARYSEKKVRAKRQFELYPDKIRIRLHQRFGQRYDISVKLNHIDPERDRFWVKDPAFESLASLAFVISLVLVFCVLPLAVNHGMLLFYVPLGAVVSTFVVLLFHNKRVEVARFISLSGSYAFDIGAFGNERKEYEDFVGKVEARIKTMQVLPPEASCQVNGRL